MSLSLLIVSIEPERERGGPSSFDITNLELLVEAFGDEDMDKAWKELERGGTEVHILRESPVIGKSGFSV